MQFSQNICFHTGLIAASHSLSVFSWKIYIKQKCEKKATVSNILNNGMSCKIFFLLWKEHKDYVLI